MTLKIKNAVTTYKNDGVNMITDNSITALAQSKTDNALFLKSLEKT